MDDFGLAKLFLDHPHVIMAQLEFLKTKGIKSKGKFFFRQRSQKKFLQTCLEKAKTLQIPVQACTEAFFEKLRGDYGSLPQDCLYLDPQLSFEKATPQLLRQKVKIRKGLRGVVLDQIQDPQNFGNLLRSAAFFGLDFCLFPAHHQSALTSTVLRVSCGGAFGLDLWMAPNLKVSLNTLKEMGFWLLGTDLSKRTQLPSLSFPQEVLDQPLLCVLGQEGKGLRPGIAKECDWNIEIPSYSRYLDSLNVAVVGGILFAQFSQKRMD